jgi:hypothetical protein
MITTNFKNLLVLILVNLVFIISINSEEFQESSEINESK